MIDFSDIKIHITVYDVMPAAHRLHLLNEWLASGGMRRAGKTQLATWLFQELR
jgi:hypothetical protein